MVGVDGLVGKGRQNMKFAHSVFIGQAPPLASIVDRRGGSHQHLADHNGGASL